MSVHQSLVMSTTKAFLSQLSEHWRGYRLGISTFEALASFERDRDEVVSMLHSSENVGIDRDLLNGINSSSRYATNQLMEYTGFFALSVGEFPVAVDFLRHCIKSLSKETASSPRVAPLWMLRGLAFAGMGSYIPCIRRLDVSMLIGSWYLARVHCRQAKLLDSSYRSIDDIYKCIEEMEIEQANFRIEATHITVCVCSQLVNYRVFKIECLN